MSNDKDYKQVKKELTTIISSNIETTMKQSYKSSFSTKTENLGTYSSEITQTDIINHSIYMQPEAIY